MNIRSHNYANMEMPNYKDISIIFYQKWNNAMY